MKTVTMLTRAALLLAVGLALPAIAQQTQSAADAGAREKIEAITQQYRDTFNNKDAAGIAALFAENGVLMLALPTPIIAGRPALQKFYEAAFQRGVSDLHSTVEDVRSDGEIVWARGTYDQIAVPSGASPRRINGVWSGVYRRQAGGYQIEQIVGVVVPPATGAPLVGSSTPPQGMAPPSK